MSKTYRSRPSARDGAPNMADAKNTLVAIERDTALRNAVMSAKSQEDWQDHLSWLYGGTGLDNRV